MQGRIRRRRLRSRRTQCRLAGQLRSSSVSVRLWLVLLAFCLRCCRCEVRIGEGEREKWVERGQRGEGCVLMLVMTEVKLMSAENGGNMFFSFGL